MYFIGANGQSDGIQANVIDNGVVIPNAFKEIPIGTMIYRNSDFNFNKLVEREDSAIRKIGVTFNLKANERGFTLNVVDEDGHEASTNVYFNKETTKTGESIEASIKKNLIKTGNTPFIVDEVNIDFESNWFVPNSKISELRREVLIELMDVRINEYDLKEFELTKTDHPYPIAELDFTHNISNKLARKFYKRHGVKQMEKAFELQWDAGKSRVMTTKYCVKYELGKCPK